MKTNNHIQQFILNTAWVYRNLCLIITLIIAVNNIQKEMDPFICYFSSFIWLSLESIILVIIQKDLPKILVLMVIDYFIILLFQYFEPHCFLFIEFMWLPYILLAIILILPLPLNILLTFLMGIPGIVFLSYGYYAEKMITINNIQYPYYFISLFISLPLTGLTILIGSISSYMNNLQKKTRASEILIKQLNKLNKEITQKMFYLRNDTTQEVRKYLSKEIHDTAGYVFVNLIMMLQAASAVLYRDITKADKLIHDARDYADRGINEIRYLLRNIRDTNPIPISIQNIFFETAKSFSQITGVMITIDYGSWPKNFSIAIDSFFVSFLQECLTNSLKHGQATIISVSCWDEPHRVTITIRDNGKGATLPLKKGIGISAMDDFVQDYQGLITIKCDETGFQISAMIPKDQVKKHIGSSDIFSFY